MDYTGKFEDSIYIGYEKIDWMFVGTDVIFFRRGASICRLYLPTNKIDILYTDESLLDFSYILNGEQRTGSTRYKPLSTTDFYWFKLIVEFVVDRLDDVRQFDKYAYSDLTKKTYLTNDEWHFDDGNDRYLGERAKDLESMGLDPYTISYRVPD